MQNTSGVTPATPHYALFDLQEQGGSACCFHGLRLGPVLSSGGGGVACLLSRQDCGFPDPFSWALRSPFADMQVHWNPQAIRVSEGPGVMASVSSDITGSSYPVFSRLVPDSTSHGPHCAWGYAALGKLVSGANSLQCPSRQAQVEA